MWAVILKILASPKNAVIAVLLLLLAILSPMYWYNSVRADNLKKEVDMLNQTVKVYRDNSEAIKKVVNAQQKIENRFAELKTRIEAMKPSKCVGVEDEKVFTDITWMFNNYGLSPDKCIPSKEGVPSTSKTCVGDTNWTGQQIARNYEELVKSYLQLEETVACYENN